jgi:signal peptidase II
VTIQQFLLTGCVFAADQVTKAIVTSRLRAGESIPVGLGVRIQHMVARFRGVGIMHSRMVLLLLWLAALGGMVVATQSGYFFQQPAAQTGLAVAVAGAAGNLCDRLWRGGVIDFLDLGWWPVFNLADVAITLGAAVAIWFI